MYGEILESYREIVQKFLHFLYEYKRYIFLHSKSFINKSIESKSFMKKLPQLREETGISSDYWNNYAGKILTHKYGGFRALSVAFNEFPIPHYAVHFDQYAKRHSLIIERTPPITELDSIADELNRKIPSEHMDEKDFVTQVTRACEIVHGSLMHEYIQMYVKK